MTGNRMVPAFYIAASVTISLFLVWTPTLLRRIRNASSPVAPAE